MYFPSQPPFAPITRNAVPQSVWFRKKSMRCTKILKNIIVDHAFLLETEKVERGWIKSTNWQMGISFERGNKAMMNSKKNKIWSLIVFSLSTNSVLRWKFFFSIVFLAGEGKGFFRVGHTIDVGIAEFDSIDDPELKSKIKQWWLQCLFFLLFPDSDIVRKNACNI